MSFNPDNDRIVKLDTITPVEKINELAELNSEEVDFQAIEQKASIFAKDAKFVPVDESVKLVSVEKNGKIIYENDGKMQLAESQLELAETKNDEQKCPVFSDFSENQKLLEKKTTTDSFKKNFNMF